jgi:hypothetical protein
MSTERSFIFAALALATCAVLFSSYVEAQAVTQKSPKATWSGQGVVSCSNSEITEIDVRGGPANDRLLTDVVYVNKTATPVYLVAQNVDDTSVDGGAPDNPYTNGLAICNDPDTCDMAVSLPMRPSSLAGCRASGGAPVNLKVFGVQ